MEIKNFKICKMSTYTPEEGIKEWYELQPQYDNKIILINLNKTNGDQND